MLYLTDQDTPFTGAQFLRILRLCFRYADCFSLTELHRIQTPLKTDLQRELRPFLGTDFETRSWFLTPKMNPPRHIFLYRADPEALPVLERYAHSLSGLGYRMPEEKLEDLCFFSGYTLFFGILAPDGFCGVYPPTEGFEKELLSVREDWRSAPTSPKPLRLANTLRHYIEKRT